MQAIGYLGRNRILRRTFPFLFLLFLFGTESLRSQWKLEPVLDSLVVQGIDMIWRQHYAQADSLFQIVTKHHPEHPSGYIYRATVLQAKSIDEDILIDEGIFDSLLEIARAKSALLESPWREYYQGTADGCDAYERVERGDWFGGVKKGIASASAYEDVLEKDSSFYDAYVGLGTYYYWSSRKTAFIRWLPFVEDNRELGKSMLMRGAQYSEYNRCAALSALISIYLDSEEYIQVEDCSRAGLKLYPDNRIFLWGLVTSLDRQKKYSDAVKIYSALLDNIVQAKLPHPYGEIVCRLNLAKSLLSLKDSTGGKNHLLKIMNYHESLFPKNIQARAEDKFKETKELLASLEKKRATE